MTRRDPLQSSFASGFLRAVPQKSRRKRGLGVATVGGVTIREALRAGLKVAMQARDKASTGAIRSALGAIDNAEAIDATVDVDRIDGDSRIAGAVAGAGSTEVRRRTLTDSEVADVLRAEIADRLEAADEYDAAGPAGVERAALLRSEAATLEAFIGD